MMPIGLFWFARGKSDTAVRAELLYNTIACHAVTGKVAMAEDEMAGEAYPNIFRRSWHRVQGVAYGRS